MSAPHPQGEALAAQLLWVHDMVRRDLDTVQKLADEVAEGLAADAVTAALRALQVNGPLWQLKVNCLQYCNVVHGHHRVESAVIFPALRRTNPALDPVVDRLEADHLRVTKLLDDTEAAARGLGGGDDSAARGRLVAALKALAADLLPHLEYEEEHILDTMRTWAGLPR
ncbi:hemerythrin domain-containing protein [Streptomyces sp. NBC_01803]|uniref:hemerythrin domain-containing protein n=1 Tax=Streptomyces sp. NBC_01803 TaxID=2975946 RepID=UPI002DD97E09|nr:hemerythrin domain-containing protein [Streptomyces sp. NBC_01803]WSA44426.1 hemerythrin domain-containing protein [Streptomyces sp. NBC_01803]